MKRTAAPVAGAAAAAAGRAGTDPLEDQLAAIRNLSRSALVERWSSAYGRPPPKGLSRRLLEYAAAYDLQTRTLGGLNPATRRKLLAATHRNPDARFPQTASPKSLAPGSRLLREWKGRSHSVEAVDGGFLWSGRHYASLSAIARTITGTSWSGPRFFGL